MKIDEYLQTVLTNAEKVNEYDYKQMITEFDSIEANETLRRSKVKQFKDLNQKWKRTVSLMKTKKEEIHLEAINKRVEAMAAKKLSNEKILKENEEKKQQTLDELKSKNKQSVDLIHNKNQLRAQQIEQERLQNQKKTSDKLRRISDYRSTKMNEFKENFVRYITKSLDHFKENWREVKEQKEKREEELRSKVFDKFAGWVSQYY